MNITLFLPNFAPLFGVCNIHIYTIELLLLSLNTSRPSLALHIKYKCIKAYDNAILPKLNNVCIYIYIYIYNTGLSLLSFSSLIKANYKNQ